MVSLRLRNGLLPDDFAAVGRIVEAGVAGSAEKARWDSYKLEVGKAMIAMAPEAVLERID